jgi:GYF domain 2
MNTTLPSPLETNVFTSLNRFSAAAGEEQKSAADVYLSIAGQRFGPYCLTRALTLVRRNHLEARAWLWRAGMIEWRKITDYLRLRSSHIVRSRR